MMYSHSLSLKYANAYLQIERIASGMEDRRLFDETSDKIHSRHLELSPVKWITYFEDKGKGKGYTAISASEGS